MVVLLLELAKMKIQSYCNILKIINIKNNFDATSLLEILISSKKKRKRKIIN